MKNYKLFSLVLAVVVTFLIFSGIVIGFTMMTDWFNGLSTKMQNVLFALMPLMTGVVVTLGAILRFRKRKIEVI